MIVGPVQYAAPLRSASSKQSPMQRTLSMKHETKVGALKLGSARWRTCSRY